MVKERLMEILRCPLGKAKLRQQENWLICEKCGLQFPIRDEIPVMLLHEAKLPDGIKRIEDLPCQKENKQ